MLIALSPSDIDILVKLLLAALLGSIVGLERRLRGKDVGMRTHALVAMGAALFASIDFFFQTGDVTRIAAGVVTSIGFIATGIIFKSKDHVIGITTATELWIMAAIGIAVGFGLFVPAIAVTVIILLILDPAKSLEERVITLLQKRKRR